MNEILLNVVVLVFEVLYYALFMKFARKEGKFWKYLLSFGLVNIILLFIGTNQIYSYLLCIIMMLYGLKYIVGIKMTLYDMFFIMIMLMFKALTEHIVVLIFFVLFKQTILLTTFIFSALKFILLIILKNKLNLVYNYILIKWNNNNFYIRYLFTIFMFCYVIISIITILFY